MSEKIRLFHGSKNGKITDIALVESLSALKLGIQYVAITQRACNAISILNENKLIDEEKSKLIVKSEENQQSGISLANEICRKYRRESKYFDELIKEVLKSDHSQLKHCNNNLALIKKQSIK